MAEDVTEMVERWLAAGDRVAVATVVETKRSAPQPVGTKMAVNDSASVWGAVSGGCVEGAVVEVAEAVIAGAAPQLLTYGIADDMAWDVGLPCGGEISVWVEPYAPDGLERRFFQAARAGERAALVTVVSGGLEFLAGDRGGSLTDAHAGDRGWSLTDAHAGDRGGSLADAHAGDRGAASGHAQLGAKLLVPADGEPSGTLGDPNVDEAALLHARAALWSETPGLVTVGDGVTLFVDVVAPPPQLIIVGAIDFAAQLAEVARIAGWRPFIVDPRARFATPERFPAAERVIVAWPQEAFAQLGHIDPATAIAVLTHDPKLDDAALKEALATEAFYVGAMGSRVAQERRRARLAEAGFDPAALERVSAPIGLDLGALTAAETALSIMAEIVALKHGRGGGRLIQSGGRIHDSVTSA